jgi:hypothetical protein
MDVLAKRSGKDLEVTRHEISPERFAAFITIISTT